MENQDLSVLSVKVISALCKALEPAAGKCNTSSAALFELLALNYGTDLSFLIKDVHTDKLLNAGFAERDGDGLKITGKGAIFAKSLSPTVIKALKNVGL